MRLTSYLTEKSKRKNSAHRSPLTAHRLSVAKVRQELGDKKKTRWTQMDVHLYPPQSPFWERFRLENYDFVGSVSPFASITHIYFCSIVRGFCGMPCHLVSSVVSRQLKNHGILPHPCCAPKKGLLLYIYITI